MVEERGPVDRLRQQLRRSVQCAEREPRDYVRRLVRVRGCDRQRAEHARRNVGLLLGQPLETGDPLCGIVGGLRVELGRSEGGALERERRAPVGGAEAGARPVEHLQRLPVAAADLQHASQRESDRDLGGRGRRDVECGLQVSGRLRVSRVRLGEAEFEQDGGSASARRR